VAKLNSAGSALVYATYLGGTGDDVGSGIAVTSTGTTWVAGAAGSADFPTLTPAQASFGGGAEDAFLSELSDTGTLIFSTLLGGSKNDEAHAVALTSGGDVWVAGHTFSSDLPTVRARQAAGAGGVDAFLTRVGSAALTGDCAPGTQPDGGVPPGNPPDGGVPPSNPADGESLIVHSACGCNQASSDTVLCVTMVALVLAALARSHRPL
jgi:hypothetical protein